MERADLEAQALALTEYSERSKAFPLYFYEPAGVKHASYHESRAFVRILAGGNRSAKTHTGVAEASATYLGYRPWILRELGLPIPEKPWLRPSNLPDKALVFNGAGVRIATPGEHFFVSGLPMKKGIGEVAYPKFKLLMGPFIKNEWMAHGGVPACLEFKNDSRVHFGSDEQDAMAFEGTNYASIAIDEPIKRRHYTAIRRGAIDQFARISMTFTPIGPSAPWIFKDLYNEKDRKRVEVFNVSIYDNKYLPKEAIDEFVNDPTLSELEKQARIFGRFMHLADRIYTQWDPDIHFIAPFRIPDDWYCGMVVDPHSVRPWAIAYFAVSPRGDFYFIKEWPESDFTKIRRDTRSPNDYAQLIRRLDADLPLAIRLMDPNYATRAETIRGVYVPALSSEMARYGLHFDCAINDNLEYGEAKVRGLLSYDTAQPITSINRPRLYVFETCPNIARAMEFYSFKSKAGSDDAIADDIKRDETYKDFADVVRYTAVKLADCGAPDLGDSDHYSNDTKDEEISCYGEDQADQNY